MRVCASWEKVVFGMRILEKFLLFIFSLLLAALGVGGLAACFNANLLRYVNYVATLMTYNRWITLIVSACLLLLAVLVLFGVVFSSSGSKDKGGKPANVVQVGADGDNIQISTAAVDCIIQQQKVKFSAVNEMETKISTNTEGVQIILKVTADAAANMPELAANLQNAVKEQLESMVGLNVASVKVIIADVVPSIQPD
jgi:flagellar basal body-associated protein FliL